MKSSVEVEFSNTPPGTGTFLDRGALVDEFREDAGLRHILLLVHGAQTALCR
jgi:hypothetical protein